MNIADAAQYIESHLNTNWVTTPIAWENVPAKDHAAPGQPMLEEGTDDWIRASVEIGGSQAIEIPVACTRYLSFLIIDINTKEDTGTRQSMAHMDALSSMFEYKTISGVRMKEVSIVGSYQIMEGWMTTTVQIPFEFDRQL